MLLQKYSNVNALFLPYPHLPPAPPPARPPNMYVHVFLPPSPWRSERPLKVQRDDDAGSSKVSGRGLERSGHVWQGNHSFTFNVRRMLP